MKKLFTLLIFISFIAIILGCSRQKDQDNNRLGTPTELGTEDYKVYSSILKHYFDNKSPLIIIQQTISFNPEATYRSIKQRPLQLKTEFPAADTFALFKDYEVQNQKSYTLNKNFDVNQTTVLLSEEGLRSVFQGNPGGWAEFYKKYPTAPGYIMFSRIGFNSNQKQAILKMDNIYGGLGADGLLFYLEKEQNNWVAKKIIQLWIS